MQAFHGFKKVATDKKTTTFAHPNGSKLIVAHASLDPKTLKQISALPVHKACGGPIQKYAGDESAPENSEVLTPEQQEMKDKVDERMGQLRSLGSAAKDFLFGSPAETSLSSPPAQATPNQPAAAPTAAPTNIDMNQSTGAATPPQNGAPTAPPQGNFQYDPYQGLNTQMAGIQNEAKAVGNVEDEKAKIFEQNQKDLQNIQNTAMQNAAQNANETWNQIEDMKNSHIDPKAYINNMGTGQKVATAIGLMLGGIGGGLLKTGGNVAMDFLNKQIDRDVAAQQSNIDNKKTIFNAMQAQYGNSKDAINMTRAFYLSKMQNEINTAAAKSGSPLAIARAQQLMGPIQQQLQELHYEVGMRQAAMQGGMSSAAAIPFLVKNPAEQGKAIEAFGKIQELNKLHQAMRESAQHLRDKIGNGALSPNDTASAKQAFAGAIQKLSEGRYNEDAANKIVTSLLPQMGDMGDTGANKDKRMDEFFDAFRQEPNTVLQSHFIPAPQMPPRFKKRK